MGRESSFQKIGRKSFPFPSLKIKTYKHSLSVASTVCIKPTSLVGRYCTIVFYEELINYLTAVSFVPESNDLEVIATLRYLLLG